MREESLVPEQGQCMTYRFPVVPEIERAYRAAHAALEGLASEYELDYAAEADLGDWTEVVDQFRFVAGGADMAVAMRIGPAIDWCQGGRDRGEWGLTVAGLDLDHDGAWNFGPRISEAQRSTDWALDKAARAYRQEARWPNPPPGDEGLWLLMLAPLRAKGSPENDKPWSIHGRLAGFAILWDRDKDGNYETVAHAWTAQAWRRQGIARRLLDQGRSRFAARQIAGPLTDDGAALARSCWPNARIVR